ncbi:MAG: hypothetical protein AAF416_02560 [Pseudomonadota bacterium]
MFIPQASLQADENVPQPGEQVAFELQDEHGTVLHRAVYDLEQTDAAMPEDGLALGFRQIDEAWPDAAFQAEIAELPTLLSTPKAGKGVDRVAATRLAWDIIKDNQAVVDLSVASTSILNPDNMNPFDYSGAQPGQSRQFYWWGYHWPRMKWKCFEVWIRLNGAYGASAPAGMKPGLYIPSLYIDFPKAPWTGFGLRMKGETSITPPYNAGSPVQVVAHVDVITSISISSILDPVRTQPFRFSANGQRGFEPR